MDTHEWVCIHECIYVLCFLWPPHGLTLEIGGRRLGTQSKPKWVQLYPEASMSAAECHRQDIRIAVNLIHGLMNTGAIRRDHLGRRRSPGGRNAVPPRLAWVPITDMVPDTERGIIHIATPGGNATFPGQPRTLLCDSACAKNSGSSTLQASIQTQLFLTFRWTSNTM